MVSGLRRMMRLVLRYPARFVWFLLASLLFGGLSTSYVGVVHTVTSILDTREVPAWMSTWLGIEKFRYAFFLMISLSAGIAFGKCLSQYLRRYLQAWLTRRVVLDTQARLADHILGLDLVFFQQRRAGELLSRATNDLMFLGNSVKLTCITITRPITLLWFLGAIFYINWRLALLGLIAAPIGGIVISSLSRKMRKAAKRAQEKKADLTSVMVQFLAGMRTVKAFTCESFESETFAKENRKLFDVTMKRERARARIRPVVEFVSFTGMLVVMAIGGEWVFNGTLKFADLTAFLTALGLMYAPAKELSGANSDLMESLPGAERVFELLDMQPQMQDGARTLDSFENSIELKRVDFSYIEDTPVLQDISLTIRKGECVALVGPTGAGKSTLADMVLRFHDPQCGEILIDGIDIREYTFDSLRRQIALVNQDPFLFNCSIRDNIAYGRADAEEEAIQQAARAAAVHDEIEAMPNRYDTVVGERGSNLSGGQRQRVAMARAIFKNAPILILDEATSSLDSESERRVQEALDHLMEGRTSLVIAHRLSTIRHADKIVVLERGVITAIGTHDELLEKSPTYANFVRLQSTE